MDVAAGDIYSTADKGAFGVVKVLAVQGDVLTVRLYANRYDVRPTTVDATSLNVAIAAIPMKATHLASWEPVLLMNDPLRDDELEMRFVPEQRKRLRGLFRRR